MSGPRQASLAALALLAGAAAAADDFSYRDCVALASRRPVEAFERALGGIERGAGMPARHCAALALSAQGLHDEAADRLEKIAEDMLRDVPGRRAEILGQAGNAWLLAGHIERAVAVFTTGLRLAPGMVDLYIDRARAYAGVGDLERARRDLDDALAISPEWIEALVFRASARRQLGDQPGARADVERALALAPGHAEGLLESGMIHRMGGNERAARSAWLETIRLAPNSAAAEAARRNIELLDVKKE
jgi:tetratricopeptide (TPR) repeat protein